ncbi:phage protein, HK97 gp10 family [Alkalibacterium subtropicum]|uniref:Phage protein, HK97 gp10 family n=1 Tax=Alkalibacterium subtropicum TaxID=753702 RepID=A0A1I1EUA1_9LACT|nr:HK97-gp10 family putative phage morphogenesis protein [Alkalibacterium subtropicum]SFB90745.1 phage protein, HK97 gp10 family [Alkalibacterium subtropicum]
MANNFKFEDNSIKIKKQLSKNRSAAMEAALLLVEGQAKSLAAVKSGELRDKLDHIQKENGNDLIGLMGSPNEHSFYVEFGTGEYAENGAGRKGGWVYKAPNGKFYFTRGQKPQPFLRPAFRRNKQKIIDTIGKEYGVSFKGK